METTRRTVTRIAGGRIRYQVLGWVALAATLGACGGSSAGGGPGGGGNAATAGRGGGGAAGGTTSVALTWAEWPMPNGPTDVAGGAPNLENYTVNGDGTVTDNVTGLMWQQTAPQALVAQSTAAAYCPTLSLGGHTDWRLPTAIELISLVDFSDTSVNGDAEAAINVTAFPLAPSVFFWSSTPLGVPGAGAWWRVDFNFDAGQGAVSGSTSSLGAERCVR